MRPIGVIVLGVIWLGFAAGAGADKEDNIWTAAPRHKPGASPAGFADLAERARSAVVHVRGEMVEGSLASEAERDGSKTSIGTGFIISREGHVITNEHVVRGVTDLRIRLYDGRERSACVVGADQPTDIALLKMDAKGGVPMLPLGDSEAVRVGQSVIAIGNPYGFNHSVTAGIVSAKERVVDRSSARERRESDLYSFFIQTDASINLGNSGGPLIDGHGAVIGISAAFWAGHPLQPAQGIGFAIPINMAKALLPRLVQSGSARRSYLGVDAQPLDPALEAALKLPSGRGALIASVEKGSPAEGAGLEPGDVVLSWNGLPVATSEDLKIDAQLSLPGARAKLVIVRDGRKMDRDVVLAPAAVKTLAPPHPSSCSRRPESTSPSIEDFDVQDLPATRAATLPGGRGVSVSRVTDPSAASAAGLKVGDIVLRIGKVNVRTPADVTKVLTGYKLGEPVPLLVRRSGFDFWMAFTRR